MAFFATGSEKLLPGVYSLWLLFSSRPHLKREANGDGAAMLLVIGIVLSCVWLMGEVTNHTWHGKIHLVLTVGLLAMLGHLLTRQAPPASGSGHPPHRQREDSSLLKKRKIG